MIRNFGSQSGLTIQPAGLDLGLSGSNIKSEQSIQTTWTDANTTKDITISSVDTTKSIVDITCNPVNQDKYNAITPTFLNSTTVRLTRNTGLNLGSTCLINIIVKEYNNVKSKQTGTATYVASDTEYSITVSSVNPNKCELVVTNTSNNAVVSSNPYVRNKRIIDATHIGLTGYTDLTTTYQLIEFN